MAAKEVTTLTCNAVTSKLGGWSKEVSSEDGRVCPSPKNLPLELKSWMGKLKSEFPDKFVKKSLRQLFIPGSHDSACYAKDGISTPWVKTQRLDFQSQLNQGVRYFDVRPSCTCLVTGINYLHGFHHGGITVNATLYDLITQVTDFYQQSTSANEILILDFTHFHNYNQDDGSLQSFFDTIAGSTLQQYLIPPRKSYSPETTLHNLWSASSKQRIIASVDFNPSSYDNTASIWNGSDLFAAGWDGIRFWPHTNNESDLIHWINCHLPKFAAQPDLWVLQDILTPTPTSTVHDLASKAHNALDSPSGLRWLAKANILIQDYYDYNTTIRAILENKLRLQHPHRQEECFDLEQQDPKPVWNFEIPILVPWIVTAVIIGILIYFGQVILFQQDR